MSARDKFIHAVHLSSKEIRVLLKSIRRLVEIEQQRQLDRHLEMGEGFSNIQVSKNNIVQPDDFEQRYGHA